MKKVDVIVCFLEILVGSVSNDDPPPLPGSSHLIAFKLENASFRLTHVAQKRLCSKSRINKRRRIFLSLFKLSECGAHNLVPRAFPSKNGWAAHPFFEGKALGTRLRCPRNQFQGDSPTFDFLEYTRQSLKKKQIHFKGGVFAAVDVFDAKAS